MNESPETLTNPEAGQPLARPACYATAALNRFWSATKFSHRAYSAKRDDGETRLYFNREALERDFGPVMFTDESHNAALCDGEKKTP